MGTYILLSACQHHDSLPTASGNATDTQDADSVEWFAQVLG